MKKILMPSQKKFYLLGNGWRMKETPDGARGLYHDSVFLPLRDDQRLLARMRQPGAVRGGATLYSDGWTLARSGRKMGPNTADGSSRFLYWDFASLPAGNIADVMVCGKLYKSDRILGGREVHGALTSGAGTATGSYGTYAVLADGISLGAVVTVAKYLAATSFEAAGGNAMASTIAENFGDLLTADAFLCCTNTIEAFATAGRVAGVMNVGKT